MLGMVWETLLCIVLLLQEERYVDVLNNKKRNSTIKNGAY